MGRGTITGVEAEHRKLRLGGEMHGNTWFWRKCEVFFPTQERNINRVLGTRLEQRYENSPDTKTFCSPLLHSHLLLFPSYTRGLNVLIPSLDPGSQFQFNKACVKNYVSPKLRYSPLPFLTHNGGLYRLALNAALQALPFQPPLSSDVSLALLASINSLHG